MTLEEKVGQMLLVRGKATFLSEWGNLDLGAAWYPGTTGFEATLNQAGDWSAHNANIQKAAVCDTRLGIPAIMATNR